MKHLIVFVAYFAIVFAETPTKRLESLIEGLREQMACGFPDKGIKPLAPLHGDNFDIFQMLSIQNINGSISNFTVFDLNTFKINSINLNILALKVNMELNLNVFRAIGDYNFSSFFLNLLKIKGKGKFDIDLIDFNVKLYARMGVVDGVLRMMDLDIILGLRKMKSNITGVTFMWFGGIIASSVFDGATTRYIKDNAKKITKNLREALLPKINDILKDYTVADLMKLLQNPAKTTQQCSIQPVNHALFEYVSFPDEL